MHKCIANMETVLVATNIYFLNNRLDYAKSTVNETFGNLDDDLGR